MPAFCGKHLLLIYLLFWALVFFFCPIQHRVSSDLLQSNMGFPLDQMWFLGIYAPFLAGFLFTFTFSLVTFLQICQFLDALRNVAFILSRSFGYFQQES